MRRLVPPILLLVVCCGALLFRHYGTGLLPDIIKPPVTAAIIIEETSVRPHLPVNIVSVMATATRSNVRVLDKDQKDKDGNNPPKGLEGFWRALGDPLPQLVTRRGTSAYASQPVPESEEKLRDALK